MIPFRGCRHIFLIALATLPFLYAAAQPVPPTNSGTDSLKVVEIQSADRYGYKKLDSVKEQLLLVGNVRLKQENTLFTADSAIYDRSSRIVEAFGNVHINDNDSIDTYSDYLLYHTDTKIAILKKNVRLTDGKSNLYTENLEYDANQQTGTYRNGGRVVNETSVLTSDEGIYYADLKNVYFVKNVELTDPKYRLRSDSLLYNTETELTTFISKTYIEDSAKRTIVTSEGFYDLKNRNASFGARPVIKDGAVTIIANQVQTDDVTGINILTGNAVFRDTAQGVSVLANSIVSNRTSGSMLATINPLMIIEQDKDSTFITADTLYSGKLEELVAEKLYSDSILKEQRLRDTGATAAATDSSALIATDVSNASDSLSGDTSATIPDSVSVIIPEKNANDSANRFFRAFRNVRIFSDSMQAVCDSLFYSGEDSIFRMFRDPILWASNSQVTGDTIFMYTKNKKPDELFVNENGLMINHTGKNMFNQIKGNRLFGYFKEGEIDFIRARGNAESIYYAKDEEDKLIGLNKASADIIEMRFMNKELNKVVFISTVTGTMLPYRDATEEDKRLRNFEWHENKRPKSKFELYGK